MRNVYLMQTNENFGGNVFLPYSVASIWAYCHAFAEIAANYRLAGLWFMREAIDSLVGRMHEPDVLGISAYIWNWEYGAAVARAVKARFPDCLVVVGGPQVPTRSEGFFGRYPQVDVLVHFEGEETFADILRHRLRQPALESYILVPGLTVRGKQGRSLKASHRPNARDLSAYPSPYRDGVFDEILKLPYRFHAYQETHRGCPYACSYCDWGSAVYTKVRPFPDERVLAEIDWFGRNRIEYLLNCDANFGILKRDEAIVEALIASKRKYGFPEKFLASYAKNSGAKIFRIATRLHEHGLTKGVNLSLQSLHDPTLELIKRKNISLTNFEETIAAYRAVGIGVVTEIIMALPGETYDSFRDGIDRLLAAGQHDAIAIYRCTILPNSEMAAPEYVAAHGIETVRSPMTMNHGSYPEPGDILEWHDTVVATATMNRADYVRTYEFAWAIQAFHCLGLLQAVAIVLRKRYAVRYRDFYEALLAAGRRHPDTLLGQEMRRVGSFLASAMSGEGLWHLNVAEFGAGINWPIEEVSYLTAVRDAERFYRELAGPIGGALCAELRLDPEPGFLEALLRYQKALAVSPHGPTDATVGLEHDFPALVLEHGSAWEACEGVRVRARLVSEADFQGDLARFAREVVWYGRKGGRYLAVHAGIERIGRDKSVPSELPIARTA